MKTRFICFEQHEIDKLRIARMGGRLTFEMERQGMQVAFIHKKGEEIALSRQLESLVDFGCTTAHEVLFA